MKEKLESLEVITPMLKAYPNMDTIRIGLVVV